MKSKLTSIFIDKSTSRFLEEKYMDVQQIRELQECKKMMQSIPIGVYKTSVDGKFLKVNEFCAKMFGYERPEDFIKEINANILYCNPESRKKLISDLRSNNNRLENYEVELKLPRKRDNIGCLPGGEEGDHIWVAVTASLNEDNTLHGTMMCVTERKRMEEELISLKQKETERLRKIQEKANEMLSKVA